MIKEYTLVKVGVNQFDLFEKLNDNCFRSLETGITYHSDIDLEDYIVNVMNLKIIVTSDDMKEIAERMQKHDTKGIQYRFAKYIK